MPALKSKDGTEILVDCCCGCCDGIRFKIFNDEDERYCFVTYTNGSFYREQDDSIRRVICKKIKKIWAIIRNKDYYYSDIVLTQDEFEEFKEYINSI